MALTTGYNLYSKAIRIVFSNEETKNSTFQKYESQIESVASLKNYSSNDTFKFGFTLGLYFFYIQRYQSKELRTQSLLKKQMIFTRRPNWKNALVLIREINSVAFKLLSIKKPEKKEGEVIPKTYLSGNNLQLKITELVNSNQKYHSFNVINGFGTALIFNNDYNKYLLSEDPFDLEENNEQSKNKKIVFVSEEDLINEYLRLKFTSSIEKIAYLMGVLINKFDYEERNKLNTSRLIKKFIFLFRQLSFKNLIKLQSEIFYTYMSLWNHSERIKSRKNGDERFSIKYYRIFSKIIQLLGTVTAKSNNTEATIALIQGYESSKQIYNILKKQAET
jgi:hypothetical protein